MKIELKNISKIYNKQNILNNISFSLENGLYGILGENGAGKTTLIDIISGYRSNYEGKVIFDREALIGYLPQKFMGYPEFTIYEFLDYIANLKNIRNYSREFIRKDIESNLLKFNLTSIKDKKLSKLSGGQLRRCGLAQAFLLKPDLILLDEPTVGLDPTERIRFKNFISQISNETTIILSTHIVSDLENITKSIFILSEGDLIFKGNEEVLRSMIDGKLWKVELNKDTNLLELESKVTKTYSEGEKNYIKMISSTKPFNDAELVKADLEDAYLNLLKEHKNEI